MSAISIATAMKFTSAVQRGLDSPVDKPPDGQITTRRREQIPLVSRMEIRPSFRGALLREPGINNHDREYGFRACAKWRIHDVQLHIGNDVGV
jgi:hypothetical protein